MNRTTKAIRRPSLSAAVLTEKHTYLCRLISYAIVFLLLFFNLLINLFNYYEQANIKDALQLNLGRVSSHGLNSPEPSPAATSRLPENVVKNLKEGFSQSFFSDTFSSLAWIDKQATDLFFDDTVTAFYFPPKYSYQKKSDCTSDDDCPVDYNPDSCSGASCLEVKSGQLFFSDHKIPWPSEDFSGASEVTVSSLGNTWLIGAVIGENQDKKIVVYSFDGRTFLPLIGVDNILRPRYPNYQGHLSFGGTDRDFLILYLGYDGLAYHFREGRMEDVSQFFGLRIADKGFEPRILRVKDGEEVFWYITSETDWKPKLFKLWQNGTDSIEGITSFPGLVNRDDVPRRLALSYKDKNQDGREFDVFLDHGNDRGRTHNSFVDSGFDNSSDRKVSSNNLITANNQVIGFAKPAEISINLGFGDRKFSGSWQGYATFQFSNNGLDWFGANQDEEIIFSDAKGQALYWRALLKKGENHEYSPFFDNFNSLSYYFRAL